VISFVVAVLGIVGLYASAFMLRKQLLASRGVLPEASVVHTPRAKAVGVPNALVGLVYYVALIILAPFLHNSLALSVALGATILAAAFSLYLAYSLLFVTRMPCAYCWTGHVVNWSILALLVYARSLRA
jgi:uncharacterized membrane protein